MQTATANNINFPNLAAGYAPGSGEGGAGGVATGVRTVLAPILKKSGKSDEL